MNKDEIARLVHSLLDWKAQYRGDGDETTIPLAKKAADALTTLSARVETLEVALMPFAELCGDGVNMHDPLSKWLTVAHLTDAKEALAGDDHGHR